MKAIGNKFEFSIDPKDEFDMSDGTKMRWIECKREEGKYLIRHVRCFKVQIILKQTIYLN